MSLTLIIMKGKRKRKREIGLPNNLSRPYIKDKGNAKENLVLRKLKGELINT